MCTDSVGQNVNRTWTKWLVSTPTSLGPQLESWTSWGWRSPPWRSLLQFHDGSLWQGAWKTGFSWDCRPQCPHVTYRVVDILLGDFSIPGNELHDLWWQGLGNYTLFLRPQIEALANLPKFQAKGYGSHLLIGGVLDNSRPYFKTITRWNSGPYEISYL